MTPVEYIENKYVDGGSYIAWRTGTTQSCPYLATADGAERRPYPLQIERSAVPTHYTKGATQSCHYLNLLGGVDLPFRNAWRA